MGLIGCGTIGSQLAEALEREYAKDAELVALVDRERAQALRLRQRLSSHPPVVSLPTLIRTSDVVIEAAGVAIAARVARLALAADREVLIMSTGGLLMKRATWLQAAQRSRGHVTIPSGGLAGIDGLKALAMGTIHRVRLTTRKPPKALAEAPLSKPTN